MPENNLDIIILVVVLISALIALSRGLVKESLSIVGWVLVTVALVKLLPVLTPVASKFIDSSAIAGTVTAAIILVIFMAGWVLMSGKLSEKVRSSKLNGLDRTLGMFFGIARAFLLVILCNILVNIMIPEEQQSETLTESKYFQIAGSFAKPVEELIPAETLEGFKSAATESGGVEDKTGKKQKEKNAREEKIRREKAKFEESMELFEALAQPKVKKKEEDSKPKENPSAETYDHKERRDLDTLVETVK